MLRLILTIVIIVIVLGYIGISLGDVLHMPMVQQNLIYLKDLAIKAFFAIVDFIKGFFVSTS